MYHAISANKRNTVLIMAVFLLLIAGIGAILGLAMNDFYITSGVVAGGVVYAIFEYFVASRAAMTFSGGKEIQKKDNPALWNVVENLSITSGLPMPRVFIIKDPAPNALATGRNPKKSYVAVTTGLLAIMNKRELEAVIAHEMSHIKNYDIRVSMIVFGLSMAVSLIADISLRIMFYRDNDNNNSNPLFLVLGVIAFIVAPIVSLIVQLAVSRQREYLADASGALLTRDSEGLASALEKIRDHSQPMKRQSAAMAHLYLNEPRESSFIGKLMSTHPPIEDRIARLRNNADRV